ncbi:MAG: FtsX-like permease family protein, partial [Exiguobacterium acetylicum]
MSGIIASVIAVALVYVFSSNIILLYARKKEFAILLSLGWRPRQLAKLLFLEATL